MTEQILIVLAINAPVSGDTHNQLCVAGVVGLTPEILTIAQLRRGNLKM